MADLVRAFRTYPVSTLFSAKVEKLKMIGAILFAPSMPGNKFAQQMPYALMRYLLSAWRKYQTATSTSFNV
jgi:hypothetical protein